MKNLHYVNRLKVMIGKIQAEIDELREEGTNKVLEYSEEIEVLKRDKIYTKSRKRSSYFRIKW